MNFVPGRSQAHRRKAFVEIFIGMGGAQSEGALQLDPALPIVQRHMVDERALVWA